MSHTSVLSCIGGTPIVHLRRLFSHTTADVLAKLELFNPGGSVKDRPARFIVEKGLRDGSIPANSHLVESSSGNLGIALAMVAKIHGLSFTCVVDPKITPSNLTILRRIGANIEMVHETDDQGGYLKTRIQRVHELIKSIPNSVWINQYANPLNWMAHSQGTANEILKQLDGPVDFLVLGVSTSGTILGIARRLKQIFPRLKIIAVDAVGSVIFGAPAGPRGLPGIGASRVPELLSLDEIDDVVFVSDQEAIRGCRELAKQEGILAGASSGSVVAAIQKLQLSLPPFHRILTIFADRGERYLDLVYDDTCVDTNHSQTHLNMTKLSEPITFAGA